MTRNAQRKTNQTIRLSLDRPTGNFWVDTGLVVLIQRFGEGEHNVQEVLEWVQGKLLQKSGNKGEYYDQSTKRVREYEKVNWAYPAKLFIKVAGSAPKVKVNGKEYFTHPPKFELLLKMKRLHEEVLQSLMVKAAAGKGGTAPTEFAGPYIHETTLGLLLALFAHVRQSEVWWQLLQCNEGNLGWVNRRSA